MRERKKEVEYPPELVLHNEMMFCLIDMVEGEMLDIEQIAAKHNMGMVHEVKRSWNTVKKQVKFLRGMLRGCPDEEQMAIGNSSDLFRLFLWRLVSTCSVDRKRYFYIYNAIKAMYKGQDLIDLAQDEKDVFGTLLDGQEVELNKDK